MSNTESELLGSIPSASLSGAIMTASHLASAPVARSAQRFGLLVLFPKAQRRDFQSLPFLRFPCFLDVGVIKSSLKLGEDRISMHSPPYSPTFRYDRLAAINPSRSVRMSQAWNRALLPSPSVPVTRSSTTTWSSPKEFRTGW